jgi:polyhydroxybutyrate depolymerase
MKSPVSLQSPLPTAFYRIRSSRPVNLYVPSSYDGHTPLPLVILLHGGGWNGQLIEDYVRLRPLAQAQRFLCCYPDGTLDIFGSRFWNADFSSTPDAAAFGMTNVDDVGYFRNLIEEVARHFALDRKRVYLIGHSNGGVMAYRMACESPDLVAGIASLAGIRTLDHGLCAPFESVNILRIYGTADDAVRYEGGAFTNPPFPRNAPANASVVRNLQMWAGYNGASNPVTDPAPSTDLTLDVAGLDTVITRYTTCPPGGAVELWTINGAGHVPTLSSEFAPRLIDGLLAHPKP